MQGKSGEFGAYQWEPATWAAESAAAGVNVPLQSATLEQQNQVAYNTLATWQKQHPDWNVGNFASAWNAGEGAPNAYLENNVGTNAKGVQYNTPAYAKSVAQYYQQYKAEGNQGGISAADVPAPSDNVQAGGGDQSTGLLPNVGTIGSDLSNSVANRFQNGSNAVEMGLQGLSSGNLGQAASGALQTAGAVAGGIGDVANSAFELIPGVQAGEKLLGDALKGIASTPTGQKIAGALQSFTQAHPEVSGDIAAAINIASVVPMFKGLGLIAGGATDALTAPLKSTLEESAASEFKNALSSKASNTLSAAEARGLDPVSAIVKDPDAVSKIGFTDAGGGNFKYNTEPAVPVVQAKLSANEDQLQQMLQSAAKKDVLVNIPQSRAQTIKDVLKDFAGDPATGAKAVRQVNSFFDDIEDYESQTTNRTWVGLEEQNQWKRGIGAQVNWQNLGTKAGEVKSSVYRSLASQVEKTGAKAGIKGIKDLNQVMGNQIESLKVLKALDGRKVAQSAFGRSLREITSDLAGAGGELVGNQAGVGYAGAIAGRGIKRLLPGQIPLTASRLLARGGRGSIASSLTKGLIGTAVPQALRSSTQPLQPQ